MNNCKLMPISPAENSISEEPLNNEMIGLQLDKIITDPIFSGSPILCKFLSYVVKETLAGHENRIKEYTIALNVLNKPTDFEPAQNGIVRIHASRLRRALANYYKSGHVDDAVIISMPKWQYVPEFQTIRSVTKVNVSKIRELPDRNISKKVTMAIFPFKTYEKKFSRMAFADSLGQRLSIELNKTCQFSILSYNIIKELDQRRLKIQDVAANLNLKYVLAGDVHFEGANIRVFARLIDTYSQHQIWSDIYRFNNNVSEFFELSDLISSTIFDALRFFISDLNQSLFSEKQFSYLPMLEKKLLKSN